MQHLQRLLCTQTLDLSELSSVQVTKHLRAQIQLAVVMDDWWCLQERLNRAWSCFHVLLCSCRVGCRRWSSNDQRNLDCGQGGGRGTCRRRGCTAQSTVGHRCLYCSRRRIAQRRASRSLGSLVLLLGQILAMTMRKRRIRHCVEDSFTRLIRPPGNSSEISRRADSMSNRALPITTSLSTVARKPDPAISDPFIHFLQSKLGSFLHAVL